MVSLVLVGTLYDVECAGSVGGGQESSQCLCRQCDQLRHGQVRGGTSA